MASERTFGHLPPATSPPVETRRQHKIKGTAEIGDLQKRGCGYPRDSCDHVLVFFFLDSLGLQPHLKDT